MYHVYTSLESKNPISVISTVFAMLVRSRNTSLNEFESEISFDGKQEYFV